VPELSLVENDCECGVSRDEQNRGVSMVQTLLHYYHICENFQKTLFLQRNNVYNIGQQKKIN